MYLSPYISHSSLWKDLLKIDVTLKTELISPHKSDFRPGNSTIKQIVLITQNIYTVFEETPSKDTWAIFLDNSKAFDIVWHHGLIYKLKANG